MRHHRLYVIVMFFCFFFSFAELRGKSGWISPVLAFQDDYHEIFQFHPEDMSTVWKVAVDDLEWSPDGERIASRSYEGISVWDANTGELLTLFGKGVSPSWSPDGTKIATCGAVEGWEWNSPQPGMSEGNGAWIWDSRTGELIHSFAIGYFSTDWPVLYPIAWNPNGTMLAAGRADGAIHLWDARIYGELRGSEPFYGMNDTYYVNFVAWSPDGTELAEAYSAGIHIWEVDETGLGDGIGLYLHPTRRDLNQFSEARIVSWHPDGKHLASINVDSLIRIWDLSTQQVLLTVGQGEKWIDIDWSPDGTILASGREDGFVVFWDGETGEQLTAFPIQHAVAFDWNPDGSRFAVGSSDGIIHIWGK